MEVCIAVGMSLGRYVSRRHASFLKYLLCIGGLYLIYCFVAKDSSQPVSREDALRHAPDNDIVQRPVEPEEKAAGKIFLSLL